MTIESLFDDLLAVPGVRGAVLFQPQSDPRVFWPDDPECQPPNERFLRGTGQIIRRLCHQHERVEVRYQGGRFIVQSLGADAAVACLTGRELNLPLLKLTLDEFTQIPASGAGDSRPGSLAEEAGRELFQNSTPVGDLLVESGELIQEGFVEPLATHGAIAAGLSEISLIATGYLGRSLVASSWQRTRPAALASEFQLSSDGLIEAAGELVPAEDEMISLASEWARAFVAACQLMCIDLPLQLVAPLNADAQSLLSVNGSFGHRGLILLQHSYLRQLLVSQNQPVNGIDENISAAQ